MSVFLHWSNKYHYYLPTSSQREYPCRIATGPVIDSLLLSCDTERFAGPLAPQPLEDASFCSRHARYSMHPSLPPHIDSPRQGMDGVRHVRGKKSLCQIQPIAEDLQ